MHPKLVIKKQLAAAAKVSSELATLTERISAIEAQNEDLKNLIIALNEKIDGISKN